MDYSGLVVNIPLAEGAGSLGCETVSKPSSGRIQVVVGKEALAGHTRRIEDFVVDVTR